MDNDLTNSTKDELCGLCNLNTRKYCCPRCEILYCSLTCYKSDSHRECSESFYRECVNEELASHQVDEESRNKMIDILQRIKEEDCEEENESAEDIEEVDSDDGSVLDLHTRVKDLNLDDPEAIWKALTDDEKNEFQAILSGGDIDAIIPQWKPWWMYRKEKRVIEDVNEINVENEALKECPVIREVPKFDSLTSIKPSEAIKYNMANVLASYAFIARYFNGEIEPLEGPSYILDISANLSSNANFDDFEMAVESVAQKCLQSQYIQTDKASLDVMKNDVHLILQGPSTENGLHYSKAAFSHLIEIFSVKKTTYMKPKHKESTEFSKKFPEHNQLPEVDIRKFKKIIKKLEYYLSFLKSCDNKGN